MIKHLSLLAAIVGLAFFSASLRAEDRPKTSDNGTLNSHDAGFLNAISHGDLAEVKLGELAEDRASSPDVKKLAQTLIKDHRSTQKDLKALAANKNLSLATDLDDKQQATYDRLSKLNGTDFDKAFVQYNIKDHESDVDLAKDFAAHAQDPDVKAFANQVVPILEKHLRMAKETNDRLSGSNR